MKTTPSLSGDRLQLISQILGISRNQYVDALAQIPRRTRSAAGSAGKLAGPPASPKKQPAKPTQKPAR